MNAFLDDSLVGLLLLCSAVYALTTLGPRNLRRRLLGALAALLARAPAALRPAAEQLSKAAEAKAQGACGGCDNCGSETRTFAAGDEIKVPIANIKRHWRS